MRLTNPWPWTSRSNWNLEMLIFEEEENRRSWRKTLGARARTNNKLNPHMTPGPGNEPGTHWWEASARTTASSLLPCNSRHIATKTKENRYAVTYWTEDLITKVTAWLSDFENSLVCKIEKMFLSVLSCDVNTTTKHPLAFRCRSSCTPFQLFLSFQRKQRKLGNQAG